ncbi:MAG: rhodanese-like domain-containing protein [Pseudomonadales bacterium]
MSLPLLIETDELEANLSQPDLLLVDVCRKTETYLEGHIPGAIHIPISDLQGGQKPAVGKIPNAEKLSAMLSSIGLSPTHHVVVYDDEGGGWAGRFIWILDAVGHTNYSYLNGGLIAWSAENRTLEAGAQLPDSSNYMVNIILTDPIAEIDDIIPRLDDENFGIWDARSPEEYRGKKLFSARGGHIPGAKNLEWTELMDLNNHLRLKPLDEIYDMLSLLGLTSDKDIVTHCQTHHRSGLTYLVAKILGYPNIKGYHGSWSEWGNEENTPIETTPQ